MKRKTGSYKMESLENKSPMKLKICFKKNSIGEKASNKVEKEKWDGK